MHKGLRITWPDWDTALSQRRRATAKAATGRLWEHRMKASQGLHTIVHATDTNDSENQQLCRQRPPLPVGVAARSAQPITHRDTSNRLRFPNRRGNNRTHGGSGPPGSLMTPPCPLVGTPAGLIAMRQSPTDARHTLPSRQRTVTSPYHHPQSQVSAQVTTIASGHIAHPRYHSPALKGFLLLSSPKVSVWCRSVPCWV